MMVKEYRAMAYLCETTGMESTRYADAAARLTDAINKYFWLDDKGYYGMYTYGRDHKIMNPRAETLGLALSILYDIAPAERQKSISTHNPHTPYGPAIFYPQISDMPSYHNNALWPFVASYWTLAQAKAGDRFQFVRFGYFCKDTKYDNTFNQVVSLKDTFVKK